MTTTALLHFARELLADPGTWLHRPDFSAETPAGVGCGALDPDAARWDLCGALERGAGADEIEPACAMLCDVLGLDVPASSAASAQLGAWHDGPVTHDDVLAALDLALE